MIRSEDQITRITGRHVLFGVVGFFACVFAVEAVFITYAVSTHTGIVSTQPYRKGLDYQQRIDLAKEQERLGWSETFSVSRDPRAVVVRLEDRAGRPVNSLGVKIALSRPATMRENVEFVMQPTAAGTYRIELPSEMVGAYIADLEAVDTNQGGDPKWRMRKRIWLQP